MEGTAGRPPSDAEADGLPMPRRLFAVAAVLLGIVMTVLDGTMVNVALPGIAADLGVAPATATWLLNAYQLTVVGLLLPMAALGESIGFRRVFLAGAAVFAAGLLAAALVASLTPGFAALLACRVVQGVGSAAVMSLTAALIRHSYPANQLGRAIGINAMVVAGSGAAAPSMAAAILAVADWPMLFLAPLPVVLLTLALAWRHLPDPPGTNRRFDLVGAALNPPAFALLFLGLGLLPSTPALAIALLAAAAAIWWVHVRRQLGEPVPMLPLDLLRLPAVRLSVAASVCAFAAWHTSFVALPFKLQAAGRSAVETGLLITPWPLGMAIAAPLVGRLADRLPTALLCTVAMAAMAGGLIALQLLPPGGAAWPLLLAIALCGAGFGGFMAPNNRTMLSAAPKARSGGAGGMQATARLLGTTIGTTTAALAFQLVPGTGPRVALAAAVGFAAAAGALSLTRRNA